MAIKIGLHDSRAALWPCMHEKTVSKKIFPFLRLLPPVYLRSNFIDRLFILDPVVGNVDLVRSGK
jgi:hypothetical protein